MHNLKRKDMKMTTEEKKALMIERLKKLENSQKNVKCGGVVRHLRRRIRNM
jgi:hypothetical protein